MARFETLLETAERYQVAASENYDRVRRIAEGVRSGFCAYLAASDGECVRLVPPAGPFQPKDYGDAAFSMPPRGFRHLAPIAFGLAVRVTRGTDWMRVALQCAKEGESFVVAIEEGRSHRFDLPFTDDDHQEFYEALFGHIVDWLEDKISRYEDGDYGSHAIGFDFSDDKHAGDGLVENLISVS